MDWWTCSGNEGRAQFWSACCKNKYSLVVLHFHWRQCINGYNSHVNSNEVQNNVALVGSSSKTSACVTYTWEFNTVQNNLASMNFVVWITRTIIKSGVDMNESTTRHFPCSCYTPLSLYVSHGVGSWLWILISMNHTTQQLTCFCYSMPNTVNVSISFN